VSAASSKNRVQLLRCPLRALVVLALLAGCDKGRLTPSPTRPVPTQPLQVADTTGAKDNGPGDGSDGDATQGEPVQLLSPCAAALGGYRALPTTSLLAPKYPVQPFYQWQSNLGYCGEVSLLQAGMRNGLWASQFNLRLLCGNQSQGDDELPAGTPLLQSGPDGYCAAHVNANGVQEAAHDAQLLLDAGDVSKGENSVVACANHAGLAAVTYKTPADLDGQAAYQDFIRWVKGQLIAGHWVTTGVLAAGGNNTEYDHIVSIVAVGTNHGPGEDAYHPDDVVYLEDHGAITYHGGKPTDNPAIPPGAGADAAGCTPYVFGIRAGDWVQTRQSFDGLTTGQPYALALPDRKQSDALLNYGVAVTGPLDDDGVTRPVRVTIEGSTTAGVQNPKSPLANFNYEAPYIGSSDQGESCTNAPPKAWMDLQLRLDVDGLTPGKSYILYHYIFDGVKPPAGQPTVGGHVALAVPRKDLNAQQALATSSHTFVATGPTYSEGLALRSDKIAVFRVVPADAP
jgi:hypothetical protein